MTEVVEKNTLCASYPFFWVRAFAFVRHEKHPDHNEEANQHNYESYAPNNWREAVICITDDAYNRSNESKERQDHTHEVKAPKELSGDAMYLARLEICFVPCQVCSREGARSSSESAMKTGRRGDI